MVRPGKTLNIPFATYDSNDPSASVTCTGLAVTDIEIYKDGGLTQRASDAGYAVDTDFDAITGIHTIQIDLADNTTAGFFSAGSEYIVAVSSITVDAGVVSFVAARFEIGYPNAVLNTTIATLSTQTSFTLTKGPAEADALNGMWCVIHDVASEVQMGYALITDYAVTTKTVTLAAGVPFTAATTDNISIMGLAPLQATTIGNNLDVTATGAAGIDWGNVENKTTANDLSGTDIQLADTVTTLTGHTAQTGDSFARIGATGSGLTSLAQASVATEARLAELDAANLPADVDTLLGRITSTLFSGITSLAEWLGLMAGKQVANATALTEIKATGAGSGTYSETTDSLEAMRDHVGDGTNLTEAGGTGDQLTALATAAALTTHDGKLDTVDANVDAILADTGTNGVVLLPATQASIDAIETDTGTSIPALLPAALVGGKMDSDATAISGDTTAADRLEAMMDGILICQVNDASATTTAFAADGFTEATDDHFNGRLITFISGALTGQQTDITDYDAAGGAQGSQQFTVTALTEAPANDVFFVVH
jgi:hypothetical protein